MRDPVSESLQNLPIQANVAGRHLVKTTEMPFDFLRRSTECKAKEELSVQTST